MGCRLFLASHCNKDKHFGKSDLGRKIEGSAFLLSKKERTRRQQVRNVSVYKEMYSLYILYIRMDCSPYSLSEQDKESKVPFAAEMI